MGSVTHTHIDKRAYIGLTHHTYTQTHLHAAKTKHTHTHMHIREVNADAQYVHTRGG